MAGEQGGGSRPTVEPGAILYSIKRVLLGKPLITRQLAGQKLTKKVALGVLSPDAISSSAYGPEQILVGLLPTAGVAAFALALPITAVILVVLVLVTLSYGQIVMVYTKQGGSYVVTRDNFGPRVAQVAAAALLIDYVVTVAVQTAAGSVAVVSAVPALGPYHLWITIGVVVVLCYVNLRGLREAGRPFAIPTYFFVGMIGLMIVVGLVRILFFGGLPQYDALHIVGSVPVHHGDGLIAGATVLVLLRSFANGGSSLTGVEAISDSVSAFHNPRGRNARIVLFSMATILGLLLAGIAYLAFITHATPYQSGFPSVLSQEARAVFGSSVAGNVFYGLLQAASALILYTGANTSFNGFPFLASFVAGDRFLPRQLTRRGHRLVFSNGIIILAVLAVALLAVTNANVTDLVPFYAIGVFSGFSMAGYSMTKYHRTHRENGWRHKQVINLAAAIMSTVVVLVFAIAKFTEGAWVVVVIFPLLVIALMRLNREYRAEAAVLERVTTRQAHAVTYRSHRVFVLVNTLDLAVIEALRYAATLRADSVVAVHFVIDTEQSERLLSQWRRLRMDTPLRQINVPDRRLAHAAQVLVTRNLAETPDSSVTVLLPWRSYAPFLGRLLHDRTANRIARTISRIPQAAATIIPYDVQARIRNAMPHLPEERLTESVERFASRVTAQDEADITAASNPSTQRESGAMPIDALRVGHRATVEGNLAELDVDAHNTLFGTFTDESGTLRVRFTRPPDGLEPGQQLRLTGTPRDGHPGEPMLMTDPHCEPVVQEGPEELPPDGDAAES